MPELLRRKPPVRASAACVEVRAVPVLDQASGSQVARAKRDRVYAKRVPSGLTDWAKDQAVAWLRAGRSVHQVAAELACAAQVPLELWLGRHESELRDLKLRMAAVERRLA